MTNITILCLHKITDVKTPSWPGMPLITFKKLLQYISKNYEVCLPAQIKESSRKKQMILTFDDGYEDFYINAYPLLKKYKIPAILNVVVNCVTNECQIWTQQLNDALDAYAIKNAKFEIAINDERIEYNINIKNAELIALEIFKRLLPLETERRASIVSKLEINAPIKVVRTKMMNVAQLKEISDNGILIGSHSLTHPNFKVEETNTDLLKSELLDSKLQLEHLLVKPIEIFAFPNGMYSELGLQMAKDAGYKYLLLVNNDLAKFESNDELIMLDRILIYSNNHYKNVFRINNYHNRLRKWLK